MVISVIGAGGKTTRIHELLEMYRERGLKVLVTTTTHMYIEDDTDITDSVESIKCKLRDCGYCMAGRKLEETKDYNHWIGNDICKIGALSEDVYDAVCCEADIVLVEADGSRHMPLKYPRDNEPVIPDNTDSIILVAGMSALGKKCEDAVHRYELAVKFAHVDADCIITPQYMQRIIRKGYIDKMKDKYSYINYDIEVTQADNLYQKAVARFIEEDKDVSVLDSGWFEQRPQIVICGGGHVSGYVEEFARKLDFYTIVIDDREEFANRERFPEADEVQCVDYENIGEYLPDGDNIYYVVVTRGHVADQACVEAVLNRNYTYLGMIGSRRKVAATFDVIRNDGYTDEQIASIHAPIGLDIGAQTPAEIAVSIMAEIISTKYKSGHGKGNASSELLNYTAGGILCIIVEKRGSSPRGVGSMMLVTSDGIIGTIGGGAVEAAAIDKSRGVTQICTEEYDMSDAKSADLGMICGGYNKILFIPV